jgi:hypothetical protein
VRNLLNLLFENFQEYTYIKDEYGCAKLIRLQNTKHLHKNYKRMYQIVDYVIARFREDISLSKIAKMSISLCTS